MRFISFKKILHLISVLLTFVFLFSLPAFAAKPTLGTITPASGTTTPNSAVTFTCIYNDPDGWENIKETYFLISAAVTNLSNSVYLYYDQNTNLIYLRDDANNTWLGGFTPGADNTIENSQAILDCGATTIDSSATSLTINWTITFKPAFSGKAYSTYLSVVDDSAAKVNLTKKGSYTVNTAPTNIGVTPDSGTGTPEVSQTFSAVYADPDGYQNIQYVYFIINTSASGAKGVYAYYNQSTNLLYLRDDTNKTWLGGYAPGSANIIENSRVKLDCSQTTIIGDNANLTVNWALTTKKTFLGVKKLYLYVRDDVNQYQTWTQLGTWEIPNYSPENISVTPDSGTGTPDIQQTFTTVYSDANGQDTIQYVYFIINTSASGTNGVYVYYNQNTNLLYLRDDTNKTWLGGFIPGTENIIENSVVKLDCSQTTVIGDTNTLIVNWAITTKPAFTGPKKLYLYIRDNNNAYQPWTQKGTWTIENHAPVNEGVTPDNATISVGQPISFNLQYSDADTYQNIQYVYFLVNTTTTSKTNCFYFYYNLNTNKIYLRNDANNAWLGGFAPGTNNLIENNQAKINCANITINGQGETLSLTVPIIFKTGFTGNKNLYLYVRDDVNAYQNWTQKGTCVIIPATLSVTVSPDTWSIGQIEPGVVVTTNDGQKITVINDGNVSENYSLKLINPANWQASPIQVGPNEYVLNAAFASNLTAITWNEQNHALSTIDTLCSPTKFSADQAGINVGPGENRTLYLQFKAPQSTQAGEEQRIEVIITAQMP
jgi:hypothetical protein